MTDGMLSQIDYFTTYNQNIQTLTEAGLGSFANQLQSMGADGATMPKRLWMQWTRRAAQPLRAGSRSFRT